MFFCDIDLKKAKVARDELHRRFAFRGDEVVNYVT